jgi:muramoyltetrapeptide carboxypeptidase
MIQPPYLKKGDKIAITCPAKALKSPMTDAIDLLKSWGLDVILGETVNAVFHQFAGNDDLRKADMQNFINDNEIKAIIAARGGYGCIRIIDQIDWAPLLKNPKWVIGFSDITIFHQQLQSIGLQSLHAQMPATITDSSKEGLESLRKVLFGEKFEYQITSHNKNKLGQAKGDLIGGNLSMLIANLGSKSDFNYDNQILFIEDVGEYFYAIDRMIRALDRAGKLAKLNGLIVGGFTDIKDNDIPFGCNVQEIIENVVYKYNYPVCYDFPAGHLSDNRALILGCETVLNINEQSVIVNQFI